MECPCMHGIRIPGAVQYGVLMRRGEDAFRGKFNDPPHGQYGNPVTDELHNAQVMGDEQERQVECLLQLLETANVFKKGHRIRMDISSSNFPRFDINPNTGEPLGMNRRRIKADNSIYLDRIRPSHLILPITPKAR